jgi:hypothetical protein
MQHLRIGHDAAKSPVTFREMRKQLLQAEAVQRVVFVIYFVGHGAARKRGNE